MSIRTDQLRFQIAERSAGSLSSLALLRWALVIVFLWFGAMKFTAYEANGIAPFITHSPIMSWLHSLFGVRGASDVIGVLELSTAATLTIGAFLPIFSALGAAMSAADLFHHAHLLPEHARSGRSDSGWVSGDFSLAWPVPS